MSSEHRPYTGTPRTAPSTRAVTTPTRSPVYGPGPTPTATAPRSAAGGAGVGHDLGDHRREQFGVPPRVDGERLRDDPVPVLQGHAHRGRRRIETHHQHADQPSGSGPVQRAQCNAASADWAKARAAADRHAEETGP